MLEPSWVGRRVSVRRVTDRAADGRPQYRDVVGDLVSLDGTSAAIDTRAGLVDVPLAQIAMAKPAPPSTADELALEAVAAAGWRPEHTGSVGGWVLRAAGGFTGRANSVLPLRSPAMPLDEALGAARAWYAERGLPVLVQVPVEARRLLDAGLGERGWVPDPDVHVLAGRLDVLASRAVASTAEVALTSVPEDSWFARYRDGGGASAHARSLLTRHDNAGFAAIRREGAVVAIGRGAVDDGWLGLTAVEVAPDHRRGGLATAVVVALWRWGAALGATRTYVQVSTDNEPALALYRRLGYWQHHDYRYRHDPDGGA